MNKIPILLSDNGFFNLHPTLLTNCLLPLNNLNLRTDKNLINLFKQYGNNIAQNCFLRIDEIPNNIFYTKQIIITSNEYGKEQLEFYEQDGDVVMKYW